MTDPRPIISISWLREDGTKGTINHFLEKLCSFFAAWPDPGKKDAPYFYDRWATDPGNRPNEITKEDIDAANRLAARTSWNYWSESIKPLSQLVAGVPLDEGLFDTGVWEKRQAAIGAFYEKAMGLRGISYASATKVLHLKRPKLIPICDSVVVNFLFDKNDISQLSDPQVAMKCTGIIQQIGQQNGDALAETQAYLARLPPGDAYRNLTKVRILDMVLWSTKNREKYWRLLGWN